MRRLSAKSLVSYLKVIDRIRQVFAEDGATVPVWFRGHSNSSWKLIPTLYRGGINPYWERELVRDFKLRSGTLISQLPTNDLEWLYLLRHHGGATRILDWSESPLVALFFALRDSTDKTAACVWALRPWSLNEAVIGYRSVPTTDNNDILSYYTLDQSGGKITRKVQAVWPVALRPQYAIHRAVGQSGMFTIHGSSSNSLDNISLLPQGKSWLQQIEIPADCCAQTFRELFDAGITTSSIFPDLDGLAADLCYRYSRRRIDIPQAAAAGRTRQAEKPQK